MVSIGKEADYALEEYLKDNTFSNTAAKRDLFKKMDKIVSANVLKNYALNHVNNMDDYFYFRGNFIRTFGMENFFSYVISNEIMVENMYIDTAQGNFYYSGMKPILFENNQRARTEEIFSLRISKNFERFITNMGLEGPFAACFVSSSLAFNKYSSDLTTVLFAYVRDSQVQIENEDMNRRNLMECAEELRDKILGLSYEKNKPDNISTKIYTLISDLTTLNNKLRVPIKYKNWF
mmetsp:Transcript_36716/g.32928  ORF Transcript_36716/g.32928 Transcript_36716/m.32928 type:complete len:235 (-) Transcript_36716:142-846(-)